MKKLILLAFLICTCATFSFAETPKGNTAYSLLVKPRKIDVWYHTSNGYHIHIVGELSHNWSFTSWTFDGTVTITGNGVNISFPVNTTMGLRISGNGKEATDVIWLTDDTKANDILNSDEVVKAFLEDINAD